MKKKSLLLAIAAMSMAAVGVGTVGTFAWYTADKAAAVAGSAANATLETSETSLNASAYTINFHIYSGASGTSTSFSTELSWNGDGSTNIPGTSTASTTGTLYKGIYNSSGSAARAVVASGSDVIQQLRVVAEWATTPTDASDVAYLKNKSISGATLTAAGNVKLLASPSAVTSVTDYASADITVTVGNDLGLTVSLSNSITALRIATNNPTGAEYVTTTEFDAGKTYGGTAANEKSGAVYHSSDALSITSVSSLTIE